MITLTAPSDHGRNAEAVLRIGEQRDFRAVDALRQAKQERRGVAVDHNRCRDEGQFYVNVREGLRRAQEGHNPATDDNRIRKQRNGVTQADKQLRDQAADRASDDVPEVFAYSIRQPLLRRLAYVALSFPMIPSPPMHFSVPYSQKCCTLTIGKDA